MYTPVVPSQTPIYSLRLPSDLRAELQEIADEDERSLNQTIVRGLREYVASKKQAKSTPAQASGLVYNHGGKPGDAVHEKPTTTDDH